MPDDVQVRAKHLHTLPLRAIWKCGACPAELSVLHGVLNANCQACGTWNAAPLNTHAKHND